MLYILDQDPALAAEYLADDDLREAIPILAGFLCQAHVLLDGWPTARANIEGLIFDPHQPITPFGVWAAQGAENFHWSGQFLNHCIGQTEKRRIAYCDLYDKLGEELYSAPLNISEHPLTKPPCWVPPAFKKQSRIESYRDYYFKTAVDPKWSAPSSTPQWFADRFALLIRSDVR